MRLPSLNKRERRRAERHWFNGSVQVLTDSHPIEGLGIQLSSRGMYLFAIADLAVGSEIKVSFVPPDSSERMQVTAAIRHRTVYLYGVEFLAAGQTATSAATLAADSNQAVVTV